MQGSARTFALVSRFVWRYWRTQPGRFVLVVVGAVTAVLVEVQIPGRAATRSAALRGAEGDLGAARTAAGWLVGTFLLLMVVQQAFLRLWMVFAADNMRRLVNDGFGRVQRFATDWHVNNFAGSTVRRITRGMWAYDTFSDLVVLDLGPSLGLLLAFAVAMGLRDPVLGLYFAGAVGAFLCVSIGLSLRYVAPANVLANAADTAVGGALADAITCNATVKAFGAEDRESARLGESTRRWQLRARRSWRRSLDTGAAQSLMVLALLGGLLAIVLGRAEAGGRIDDLVYVLTTYFLVSGMLRNIGRQVRDLQRAVNELDDLVEIDATPPQIADAPAAATFVPDRGAVRFEAVRFAYPNQPRAVFEALDLDIRAGEKVAVVGPSGAGKTTFVKLIQRLHDVDGGAVRVDGQDVRDVTQASLRAAIALVPQEPILFHRSLAENIAYAVAGADRAAIEAAARQAHAHEFIERLPEGYDTLVGERGIKLSGGERQRVAIARAILADTPLLILDEATSSLDSITEDHIQAAIEHLLVGRTAILIAHRLSTVRKVDRILVFEAGRVVEQGSHEALMARADGVYRRLFDMQALGFVDQAEVVAEGTPAAGRAT
ncbi:MAG TPA: ABC transporter ATP-binding protein [Pseudomonadales bacterium]|nr:ABC transporter ATP-binding protein [Pseudomonadales bacterium]